MKTLMKQGLVLAAVLLVVTILVAGCFAEPESYTPPDGMGAVRLNLSLDNPNARATIMPDNATINTFQRFRLDFQPSGGGAVAFSGYYTKAQLDADPIPLTPGNYILEVVAFMDAGAPPATPPTLVAATGTTGTTPFTVAVPPATPPTVSVILKAYDPALNTANGTFAWTITNSITATLTTASMAVTPVGTGTSYGPYNLLSGTAPNDWNNAAGVSVREGYYYVDFILSTSAAFTRNFRHILHIYRGHKSTFDYAFTNEKLGLVSANVEVDLDYEHPSNLRPDVRNGASAVAEGGFVIVTSATSPVTLTINNAASYATMAWWYGDEPLGTGATFDVDTDDPPFDEPGTYAVTVIGVTPVNANDPYADAPFSTEIFIKVE
jgi:hypothetical protein